MLGHIIILLLFNVLPDHQILDLFGGINFVNINYSAIDGISLLSNLYQLKNIQGKEESAGYQFSPF